MNRALRKNHRIMTSCLAFFMPVAFIVGILLREPVHLEQELPPELSALKKNDERQTLAVYNNLWDALPVQLKIIHSSEAASQRAIELSMSGKLSQPDLLVYWHPFSEEPDSSHSEEKDSALSPSTVGENPLPKEAIFLGAFYQTEPTILDLPPSLKGEAGRLILYSLPFREVVATSKAVNLLSP